MRGGRDDDVKMSMLPFADRTQAGKALAGAMGALSTRADLLVLALPRGGVPVAAEIASALQAPLDLMIVRKLGVPGQEELAMGAVAATGARVLNADVIEALGLTAVEIEREVSQELAEIERRQKRYRGDRPYPSLAGKCVILVDDGIATGATVRVAIAAARAGQADTVVVSVPVAAQESLTEVAREADEVVCLATPRPFLAIGQWYADFTQVTDAEVTGILHRHWGTRDARAHSSFAGNQSAR